LLTATDLASILTPLECLALVVAALCHDIDHSDHEEQAGTDIGLSVLYRDRPVMEVHHCEQTMNIITKAEQNIFEHVPEDQQMQLWQMIISLILATDMAQHFEFWSKFDRLVYPQNMLNAQSSQHRLLLAQIVLKASDAAATTRLFQVNERWANAANELAKKGHSSSPRTVECDPAAVAQGQIGFIMFVANPLLRTLVDVLPGARPMLNQLQGNLNEWKRRAARPPVEQ
jgi:hypothetical protein